MPVLSSSRLLIDPSAAPPNGSIVGVGSVESSFLVQTCQAIDSYADPDLPALMVFLQYLCAIEVGDLLLINLQIKIAKTVSGSNVEAGSGIGIVISLQVSNSNDVQRFVYC